MLNKNQSKKVNYWKYYAVIPALVAFVFLFQIKVIAQEKENKEKTEVVEKKDPIDVYKIHKHTTDQDLKEIAEDLKKKYNADVDISNVKRNSKEELTSIKILIAKENEETQTLYIRGDKAIKNCGIVVSLDDNGSEKIGILTEDAIDKPMIIENRRIEVKEMKNKVGDVDPPSPPSPPSMPAFSNGPLPPAPPIDMAKLPKAPKAPLNLNDKVAMKNFEKEMAEFEKKMEAIQPQMSAYEKQVEEIMAQREAIYDTEMAKYDLAMEKFDVDMEKFNQYIEKTYGSSSEEYAKNMGAYEKGMRTYEKYMRQQEKEIRKAEKNKKS